MLIPEYPILTERLALRALVPSDLDAVHAYQSRPDVCRYIPYEPRTREQVADRLAAVQSTIDDEGQAAIIGVALRESDLIIGDLMLAWRSREHGTGEAGWAFNPDHAGQGYATEACRELLPLGFDGLGLHRIIARIDVRNTASSRLAERLGMRKEALLIENEWFKGEWTDEVDYAILDREWRSHASLAG